MALKHEELTGEIIGHIFDVHNEIGAGLDEETYHRAFIECFEKNGIPYVSKERKYLMHRDVKVRRFELDLLVFAKIILALKSLQCAFLQTHYVQIISEMKLWKKDLGLLVNMGRPKAEFERMPFDEKKKKTVEDYSEIKGRINESTRRLLTKLRDAILYVFQIHGLGYGRVVYQELLRVELDHRKITHKTATPIQINYLDKHIRTYKARALLVEDRIFCGITAIQDQITLYDVARMRTYLHHSDILIGLLINFGKSCLEIRAIYR